MSIQTIDNFISEIPIFNVKEKIINDNYYFKYSAQKDIEDINITLKKYKKAVIIKFLSLKIKKTMTKI